MISTAPCNAPGTKANEIISLPWDGAKWKASRGFSSRKLPVAPPFPRYIGKISWQLSAALAASAPLLKASALPSRDGAARAVLGLAGPFATRLCIINFLEGALKTPTLAPPARNATFRRGDIGRSRHLDISRQSNLARLRDE